MSKKEYLLKISYLLISFYTINLVSIFNIIGERTLELFNNNDLKFISTMSFLEDLQPKKIILISFLFMVISYIFIIRNPLKIKAKIVYLVSIFIFLGLNTTEFKVDHNFQFLIYGAFFAVLVSDYDGNFSRLIKSVILFVASIYLPFMFAGIGKVMEIVQSLKEGSFADLYLTTEVLSNQLLADINRVADVGFFVKKIVEYQNYLFPLFYLGIMFQLTAFWILLFKPKKAYIVGLVSLLFFIMTMLANAYFMHACLVITTVTILSPFNDFNRGYVR